jgi:pyridoxine 5-phosphate synthase
VPDGSGQLTSDHGWDTIAEADYLKRLIARFQEAGIRTSIFVDPEVQLVEAAAWSGTDRIELYTEAYAHHFAQDRAAAVAPFVRAAAAAQAAGLGLNAGHDLSLNNLAYFAQQLPQLLEVSIGHALISDALYLGLENTIQLYSRALQKG